MKAVVYKKPFEVAVEDVPDPFRPGESGQQLTPQGQALVVKIV